MHNKLNCLIIHGCPSERDLVQGLGVNPHDEHWLPWLRDELRARGIAAETPQMPNPLEPDYQKYKVEFEKYPVDKDTVLVAHSCGSAFVVRWLGESKRRIAKLILVAPWKVSEDGVSEAEYEYYNHPVDPKIASRVGEIVMFTSDNEKEEGKKSLKILHDALGGKIINIHGYGHFTERDIGHVELPQLLEEVLHARPGFIRRWTSKIFYNTAKSKVK
jgi:hypothetical protein